MIRVTGRDGALIFGRIRECDTFLKRLAGLMFRSGVGECDGIMLWPCSSIHMFFMKMSLDCIFLDRERRVLKILKDFKPWRVSGIVAESHYVIEVPAGHCGSNMIAEGETLNFENC